MSRILSPVFERIQQICGFANRLHDEIDRAFFRIGTFDGEGDSLASFVDSDDDKLSRTLLARNTRRLDDEALDARGDELGVDDFKHGNSSEARVQAGFIVTRGCDVGM